MTGKGIGMTRMGIGMTGRGAGMIGKRGIQAGRDHGFKTHDGKSYSV